MHDTPDESPPLQRDDSPPDRLSLNPRSKFFDMKILERGVGIRFKDKERFDVMEYSISEGWIRVQAGKSLDRHGHPMTVKLNGPVEAWYVDTEDSETENSGDERAASAGAAAEEE